MTDANLTDANLTDANPIDPIDPEQTNPADPAPTTAPAPDPDSAGNGTGSSHDDGGGGDDGGDRRSPPSPIVAVPEPGAHGGDGPALARALGVATSEIIDLSASLNPFAPPVAAIAADRLHRDPDVLRSYPDPAPATASLAAALEMDPARVILTNGGAEAIALLAALQPVGWVADPEFSLYRRHLTEIRAGAPRWRSNPSNPLGRLASSRDQAAVWDEAFYPLATGRWTRGDDQSWRLGSLTKLWACPGLRLGFLIAPDPERAELIRHRQPRWSVNGLALAMVDPLLAATDLPGWHAAIVDARAAFAAALERLGFDVTETDACWVLIADRDRDLRSRLAARRVLVRDTSNFGLPGLLRAAIPDAAQLPGTLAAFTAISADLALAPRSSRPSASTPSTTATPPTTATRPATSTRWGDPATHGVTE